MRNFLQLSLLFFFVVSPIRVFGFSYPIIIENLFIDYSGVFGDVSASLIQFNNGIFTVKQPNFEMMVQKKKNSYKLKNETAEVLLKTFPKMANKLDSILLKGLHSKIYKKDLNAKFEEAFFDFKGEEFAFLNFNIKCAPKSGEKAKNELSRWLTSCTKEGVVKVEQLDISSPSVKKALKQSLPMYGIMDLMKKTNEQITGINFEHYKDISLTLKDNQFKMSSNYSFLWDLQMLYSGEVFFDTKEAQMIFELKEASLEFVSIRELTFKILKLINSPYIKVDPPFIKINIL